MPTQMNAVSANAPKPGPPPLVRPGGLAAGPPPLLAHMPAPHVPVQFLGDPAVHPVVHLGDLALHLGGDPLVDLLPDALHQPLGHRLVVTRAQVAEGAHRGGYLCLVLRVHDCSCPCAGPVSTL
jgi:hypothetical protein